MSIYEPFILSENGETYLNYKISVEGNIINDNESLIIKQDINENHKIIFNLKSFFFNSIIKIFKKLNDNIISVPRIIKNTTLTIPSKKENYFVYSIEVIENYVFNFLFLLYFLIFKLYDLF